MKNILFFFLVLLLLTSCDKKTDSGTNNTPVDSTAVMSKGMTSLPNPINRN